MNRKIKMLLCFFAIMCIAILGTYKVYEKKKTEEENKMIEYDDPVFEAAVRRHYTAKEISEVEGIQLLFQNREWCDMTDLKKFPKLKAVSINGATTEKIEAISKIEGLEYLDMIAHKDTDISVITDLKNLKCLDMIGGPYERIKFIGEMTQLETLTLSYTPIPDLLFLKDLKNLTRLGFDNCDIESLNGLEKLPQLEYLDLSEVSEEASMEEYKKIGTLKNLKQLSLFGCRAMEDIKFLLDLKKLELLALGELGTTDISILSDLSNFPNLGEVLLYEDIVVKNQKLSQDIEKALKERKINVTADYKDSKRSYDPFWSLYDETSQAH